MAKSTKNKQMGADLAVELVDKFQAQIEQRGFKKKRALQGAIELWLSLPDELQVFIISGSCGENVFEDLLRYIMKIDKMIVKLREIISSPGQPES